MKRVTSFILAFIIFGSAVASAIFVLQAIRREQSDENVAVNEAAEQTNQDNQKTEETNPVNENALKGTPLPNFTPTTERVSEVQATDLTVGTGDEITAPTQTVTAHYTGARAVDGIIFESSKDSGKPFTSPLNQLIQGWQTGLIGMKTGGVRRLVIPANQAYGDDPSTGRPTGDLVFDIELIAVK